MRPLQQALRVEMERDCPDVQGRQQRFHQFLQQQLSEAPAVPLPVGSRERLQKLCDQFAAYSSLTTPARRRLVTDTRQWLHELRCRLEPSAPMAPPRLRLQSTGSASTAPSPASAQRSLSLSSPLTSVHGIGPKFAGRLASMGLFVIQDLLRHYPRDHVDYSARRRIEALVAGETATIVATVRRCRIRQPPQSQPGDFGRTGSTGRLRVSRFLAGSQLPGLSEGATVSDWLHRGGGR